LTDDMPVNLNSSCRPQITHSSVSDCWI